MTTLKYLLDKINDANISYRMGSPIISDKEYDTLIDELSIIDPNNSLLNSIGFKINDSRKSKLPIEMRSMNKVKSIEEIKDWFRTKNIVKCAQLVITPKYDGLSLCVNELTGEAWTRGDGEYGQKSDEHYKLIKNKFFDWIELSQNGLITEPRVDFQLPFTYTFGEVMMPKKTFLEKYSNDFANPRNLVAGLLNSKEATEPLKDLVYIKYGAYTKSDKFGFKSSILDELNKGQSIKVPYETTSIGKLTEDYLQELFTRWSQDFEIDGLIIEVDHIGIQNDLGRETSSNNPCYARAYKSPNFEQTAESEIMEIDWMISKNGLLKPIARLSPVKLDGATISNVTCNNARFVKDMGLGKGSIVKIKRSGMVIPLIVDVIKPVDFVLPTIEGVEIDWNENGVELITLTETDEQKIKKIVSFFEILEADNFGEGVIRQIWEAGYKTIKDFLSLNETELSKIDRFGKRKSTIVYNSIQKCIKDVSLSKLQHASGIFVGLGSKKLALLEHFSAKPSIEDVMVIDGFAETSAKSYIDGYDSFFDFIKDLPITIKSETNPEKKGNLLDGTSFVFTGVRLPEYEKIIVDNGGKIGSSVSKNTTHLVMKSIGSGSSKEKKAIDLGIKIITVEDLEKIINEI